MQKVVYILLSVFLCSAASAQEPSILIGKTFNSLEVTKFIKDLGQKDSSKEMFVPTQQTFRTDYNNAGTSLEFNSNLILYRITLYDSGYSFKSYKGELPFGLRWNLKASEIEEKIGALEETDDNPFKRLYTRDNHTVEFYFTNLRLSSMRLTISYEALAESTTSVLSNWGFRLLPDGKQVSGNIVDGRGTMRWGTNAAIYQGEWAYGLPHGQGQYVDSLGNKYEGDFKLGFFWGKGKFYSEAQGMSYDGEFVMGKRHGSGHVRYTTKQAYQGDFFQDYMHGTGSYVVSENYYYIGEMTYNEIKGKGVLKTTFGTLEGQFANGKPNGYCEQVSFDGAQILKGQWINGKREGEFDFVQNGVTTKRYFSQDIEIESGPVKDR